MKRAERHHLKENELAHLARATMGAFEAQRRRLIGALVAVVLVAAAVVGYLLWRGSVEERAGTLLAEALVVEEARVGPPPAPGQAATGLRFPTERERYDAAAGKFKAVADQYPATDAGLFARYRQGTMQMALGNHKDAVATYQQVVDRAGEGLYGQMARLGVAEAQARAGDRTSRRSIPSRSCRSSRMARCRSTGS